MSSEDRGLSSRLGPLEIDWPRSAGYYGGVAVAVAFDVIEWPVGLFLAAIPLVKLLNRGALPRSVRFTVQMFDGMAKPVGGDSKGTIQMSGTPRRLRAVTSRAATGKTSPRAAAPRSGGAGRTRASSTTRSRRTPKRPEAVRGRQQRRPVVEQSRGERRQPARQSERKT